MDFIECSVKFMMPPLKSFNLLFAQRRNLDHLWAFFKKIKQKKFCLSKKINGDNYMLFFFSEFEEMILALSECDNYFST